MAAEAWPSIVTDNSAYLSSGRTGIRCVLRVGIGFPHQAAVVKAIVNGGS